MLPPSISRIYAVVALLLLVPGLSLIYNVHRMMSNIKQCATTRKARIVLFGDSLTEKAFNPPGGWAGALANYYTRKADIVNRGFGGYNSRWGLHMAPHLFPNLEQDVPLLVTIFFGANDAALPGKMSDKQHVPVLEYQQNLKDLVRYFKDSNVQNIVLLAPPPVFEPGRLIHQKQIAVRDNRPDANTEEPDRTNAAAGEYAKAVVAAGKEVDVPVVDLWAAMQQESNWASRFLIEDGLHFSEGGNQFVFQELQKVIEKDFPSIVPDALARHMPMWFEVNPTDPAATFNNLANKAL